MTRLFLKSASACVRDRQGRRILFPRILLDESSVEVLLTEKSKSDYGQVVEAVE
jgi:hypothetical protein